MTIKELMEESYKTAVEKGWYDSTEHKKSLVEEIALMHAELSEAVEEIRNDSPMLYYDDKGKPEGVAVEFADVLIRMFDSCQARGIPLEYALRVKLAYNKTRPNRHGGKKL